MNSVLNLFNSLFRNETEVLQALKIRCLVIESTSRCNLKCEMCPRNSFKQTPGDIDLELFKKISKYFKSGMDINLAGWGEPLLHTDLMEMIRIAKTKNARVGFTTNATLLDSETSKKLIKSKLDFIDFSIDGATPETYEQIRKGAKFYNVINNIKNFIEIKESLESKTPSTSITFVMMKRNIHELPSMVELAKKLNVDVLTAKNFNVLTNKTDLDQIIFSHDKYNKLDENFIQFRNNMVSNAVSISNNLNVKFIIYPFESDRSNKCRLASTALFISHNGEVAICCATGYPVPRMLNGTDVLENAKIIYGNFSTSKLSSILQAKGYIECRNEAMQEIIPVECKGCLLSEGI